MNQSVTTTTTTPMEVDPDEIKVDRKITVVNAWDPSKLVEPSNKRVLINDTFMVDSCPPVNAVDKRFNWIHTAPGGGTWGVFDFQSEMHHNLPQNKEFSDFAFAGETPDEKGQVYTKFGVPKFMGPAHIEDPKKRKAAYDLMHEQ